MQLKASLILYHHKKLELQSGGFIRTISKNVKVLAHARMFTHMGG